MRYQRVRWVHDYEGEVVVLTSEIDEHNIEVRRVDEYRDGKLEVAGCGIRSAHGGLAQVPIDDSLDEINSDPQFVGESISSVEFERLWTVALAANGLDDPGAHA